MAAIWQTFSNEFPLKWVSFDLIIHVPILVWLMSGADQVKSHYSSPMSPPGQDGRHFAEGIFRCISMNEEFSVLIRISLKFVPKGPIDNNPALVKIMGWWQAIIWTNADRIHLHICVALGGDELMWVNASTCLSKLKHWLLVIQQSSTDFGHHWFRSRLDPKPFWH